MGSNEGLPAECQNNEHLINRQFGRTFFGFLDVNTEMQVLFHNLMRDRRSRGSIAGNLIVLFQSSEL
jgi:hypothetical protein